MKKFHTISIVLGGVLFVFLIWSIKPWQLWQDPKILGRGLLAFIMIDGVAGVLFTIGWRHCLAFPHRNLRFSHIYRIYLSGTAINDLTPTAALGGELTKAMLLAESYKGPESAMAVIIGRLAYALGQLVIITLGSLIILWKVSLPLKVWIFMVSTSILIGTGVLIFLAIQKDGKLGSLARWMVKYRIGSSLMEKVANQISHLDKTLQEFYKTHPRELYVSVLWNIAAMVCGILQCWIFLILFAPSTSIYSAAGIWLIGCWMDLVAFALPHDVGILEGTRVLAFKAVGFTASLGMTYGIIYRLAHIFWGGIGLLLYATLPFKKRYRRLKTS